ncbi:hypothetical protein HH310_10470 [Actinoplanes sp. TBRC 11911]|uniref:DUF6807 domain-containing protein n=1 Tax=Actinoplanes sp. TBRC 11911 TaxID=2729386 RepID=UPI00145F870F|nr:PmoA family protein [Actinoplanes sp. TBRC 11911]NMO51613.1 hypothetical protein [Actinoplanes sp. TBRC 11911]
MTELTVGGVAVATYVVEPAVDIRLAPRPYLHPVRTLGGVVVTDELCFDHPWHLGASLTVADVNGVNVWGGRTFVRGSGYVWLPDHGRIRHDGWLTPAVGPGTGDVEPHGSAGGSGGGGADLRTSGLAETLSWLDGDDRTLLTERRDIAATPAPGGWELSFRYALTAPETHQVVLGSPATHGRTGGAGYGGFFWRLPAGSAVARASDGGEAHGSDASWVAVTVDDAYTLVFAGLADKDRWFVRTGEYNGVCAALAFETPLTIPPGTTLRRHIRVRIADGGRPALG